MVYINTYEYLYIIPILIFIWYILFREKIGYTLPNALIKKYIQNDVRLWILWIIRSMLVIILVFGIAGPYRIDEKIIVKNTPGKIAIILDISRSMLAEDISPNRLEGAKEIIHTFLTQATGKDISLVVFAGKPYIISPITQDYVGLDALIERISTDTILQEKPELSGTAIGDALLLGGENLGTGTSEKHILLITDGRANVGIDPRLTIDPLKKQNIIIHTIGIGGEKGGELSYTENGRKIYFYDGSGNTLTSDIDESLLRELADTTGGIYIRATDTQAMRHSGGAIIEKILSKKEEIREKSRTNLDIFCFILGGILMIIERNYRRYLWKRYGLLKK